MTRQKALLVLALLVAIWGVNWPIMKIGLGHITPIWFATLRMLMGAPCLFAVLLVQRRVTLPTREDLPVVLSIGLVQMALFMSVTASALRFVPPGRSALLAYTTPIWVTPLAALFLKERLNALKLAGVGLGLLGVAALFNPFGFDWSDNKVVLGNGMLMAAAFAWAVSIIQVRGHRWHATPLLLMPWQMLLAAIPLVAFAYWWEGPLRAEWSPTLIAVIVYNGPIASAFGYWALVSVNKNLPAITTSLFLLGVPVVGAIASAIALGEHLGATLLTGLALILAGVSAMALADRPAT
jgi:drug/metabolite transporter (DMT)-like permease